MVKKNVYFLERSDNLGKHWEYMYSGNNKNLMIKCKNLFQNCENNKLNQTPTKYRVLHYEYKSSFGE